ncbi:MAG: hypothetical protein Tsb0010_08940 [Parvularculaceae bacterium]
MRLRFNSNLLLFGVCALALGAQPAAARQSGGGAHYGLEAVHIDGRNAASDAFSLGLLSPRDGGFDSNLWIGSDQEAIAALLGETPAGAPSRAMGALLRGLLLSGGRAPANWSDFGSLSSARLGLLVRSGHVEDARALFALIPNLAEIPGAARAAAENDLLAGRDREACLRGRDLDEARAEVFWLKLRAYCHAVAGARPAAELTLSLAREREDVEDNADILLSSFIFDVEPEEIAIATPLEFAAARAAGFTLDADSLRDAEPSVLRAVATAAEMSDEARLAAARAAFLSGALSPEELREAFMRPPFDLSAIERAAEIAEGEGSLRADALLYQAAAAADEDERARLIARAYSVRGHDGSGVAAHRRIVLAGLFAEEVQDLRLDRARAVHAPQFAETLIAAGDYERAAKWIRLGAGDLTVEEPEFGPLDPFAVASETAAGSGFNGARDESETVAEAAPEGARGEFALAESWALSNVRTLLFAAAPEAARAAGGVDWFDRFERAGAAGWDGVIFRDGEVAILSALDSTPANQLAAYIRARARDRAELARSVASETSEMAAANLQTEDLYATSATVLRSMLASAAREKRLGETALSALALLDRGGQGEAPIGAVVDAVAGLKSAGLDMAARQLAFESVWARQVAFENVRTSAAAEDGGGAGASE